MRGDDVIYLDYAATAPQIKTKQKWMLNPNQPYAINESKAIHDYAKLIQDKLNLRCGALYFCHDVSTLLEQLNYKIRFLRYSNLVSQYEHESILHISHSIFKDEQDLIAQLDHLQAQNWYDKFFVYHMLTNNITGRIYDVKSIGNICHDRKVFYCCDITAAIGHNDIPNDMCEYCDLIFASGHKFGARPAIGFVWMSDELKKYLSVFTLGGTKDLNGIEQLTNALYFAVDNTNKSYFDELLRFTLRTFDKHSISYHVVESNYKKTNAINSITLFGINADSLQAYLASKNIYISVGHSACADESDYRILKNCGLNEDDAKCTIRVSFANVTTKREIAKFVKEVSKYKSLYIGK